MVKGIIFQHDASVGIRMGKIIKKYMKNEIEHSFSTQETSCSTSRVERKIQTKGC